MNDPMICVSLTISDEVEFTFINREEYLHQLDIDIARLKDEHLRREEEMKARVQTHQLIQAEAKVLLAAELKAMEEAYKKTIESMIKEHMSKINAQNEAGRQAVEEIRRRGEQIRIEGEMKRQQTEAAHNAAMAKLQQEQLRVEDQGRARMSQIEKERAEWTRQEQARIQLENAQLAEARADSTRKREEAKKLAEDEERESQRLSQQKKTESEAAHQQRMQALKERLKQAQTKSDLIDDQYLPDDAAFSPQKSRQTSSTRRNLS